MHIVLISQCEKKAILRTAKVLDAYAVRHGDRTWITPITQAGLSAMHKELRSRGTRQTAVSCYVNEGSRRLKLLWVIGRKGAFGDAGATAVATKSQPHQKSMPELTSAMRIACLLAECAGLIHDFGKYGEVFQKKLESPVPLADPIRHEWISLQILLAMLDGKTWQEGWGQSAAKPLSMKQYLEHPHGIAKGLQTVESVLAFLVMSHHRLPRGKKGSHGSTKRGSMPDDGEYIRHDALNADGTQARPNPFVGAPATLALNRIKHLIERICKFSLDDKSPDALRAIATAARMALILSDHHISSVDKTKDEGHGPSIEKVPGRVFANTHQSDGRRLKNQELSWHLSNVGEEAGLMVQRMLSFAPPGLTGPAVDAIRQSAADRFKWQNVCADALESAQAIERLPTLVINIAGTGCGKTRMNMRAIAALRSPADDGTQEPLRIATALNLRTLTLQTRDAYAEQLGLGEKDLACIMGSQIAKRLHDSERNRPVIVDDDESEPEESYVFEGEGTEPPPWLAGFLEKKPILKPLIMLPIVVSTVDFLINAGEPNRQGNQGLAMLRMMHSDLILDEIDAYDPKAMVAVARLVTASAMWGRHVVASSATLSLPVAKILHEAYDLGMRMREALTQTSRKWRQVIIDDRASPTVANWNPDRTQTEGCNDFIAAFAGHMEAMMSCMGKMSYRPCEMQPVSRQGGPKMGNHNFFTAIKFACKRMHGRHSWTAPENAQGFTGKISIGLVRMANIRPAIEVASKLATEMKQIGVNVRVCCYHSQTGLLQRFNIERNLDSILNRKDPGWSVETMKNKSIQEAMTRAVGNGEDNICFIVVATPVEEIGRDHDFDWAVIEPSSSQSIVQTAGRVNRHRLTSVKEPNVVALQFNRRECTKSGPDPVFCRPGLETAELKGQPYGDHNVESLINWKNLRETAGQVDARLRYQTDVHPFAAADDQALTEATKAHMLRFTSSEGYGWLMKDTYLMAPLRETNGSGHLELWLCDKLSNANETYYRKSIINDTRNKFEVKPYIIEGVTRNGKRHVNDWLVLSFDEIKSLAREKMIDFNIATSVQIGAFGEDGDTLVYRDKSFGYWGQRNSASVFS